MVARKKVSSNETNLAYAKEESIGVLPDTPKWRGLEPNSYSDFGGKLTLLARNPINSSRQRKKGEVTDLEASGGFNQDFTLENSQDLLQGYMFAAFREKSPVIVSGVTADGYAVDDSAGYAVGQRVFGKGFANTANNGLKIVTSVDAGLIGFAGAVVEGFPGPHAAVFLVGIQAAAGDVDVDVTGVWPAYTSTTLDFTTLGFIPGEWVFVGGDDAGTRFAAAGNNGFKRIRSITANKLEIDVSPVTMVAAADTTHTLQMFFGRVLKNELADKIVRTTYQLERQLGKPDTTSAGPQSELIKGAVPATMTLNVKQADKLNADFTFVALDNEPRTADDGLMPGQRISVIEADAFNTSSDIPTMRLAVVTPGQPTPEALFGYLTEMTIKIDNHLTANKAVAVLGAFEVTEGTFEVTASATAYFSTVEAVEAVRNNDNAQMYLALAKHNAGFVVDMPLMALGVSSLTVTQDDPITLPLTMDAATAALINPETDYTLMWVFFDYLPTMAG